MESAIFPLHAVLFPRARLQLQIFEPRYVDMVKHCINQETGFVISYIEAGEEVLQRDRSAVFSDIGCYAQIVDWQRLDNGLLGIEIEGHNVVSIERFEQHLDGLYTGHLDCWPVKGHVSIPEGCRGLVEWLQGMTLHQHHQLPCDWSCAEQVSYRLAQILPISLQQKQHILETYSAAERLELMQNWLLATEQAFNA